MTCLRREKEFLRVFFGGRCRGITSTVSFKSMDPAQWLTPIILATWEAEIGRFEASLGKNQQDPISTNKLGVVACACRSLLYGRLEDGGQDWPRAKPGDPT
jgi:hypothetical protein